MIFPNEYLKFDYEHILGMELKPNRKDTAKMGSFHHDLRDEVEKSGFFEFQDKIKKMNGTYKTKLVYQGNVVKEVATFFPAEWSREKVISKIIEAYKYIIKNNIKGKLRLNGALKIRGFTKEGIEIEMYIISNKIKTAYPIVNEEINNEYG